MTDLKGKCPHCNHKYYAYLHLVDGRGMGKPLPSDDYKAKCQNPYCNQPFTIVVRQTTECVI